MYRIGYCKANDQLMKLLGNKIVRSSSEPLHKGFKRKNVLGEKKKKSETVKKYAFPSPVLLYLSICVHWCKEQTGQIPFSIQNWHFQEAV